MNFTAKTDGVQGFYGSDQEEQQQQQMMNRAGSSFPYPSPSTYYHHHEFMEASPATTTANRTRDFDEPVSRENDSELGLCTGGSGSGSTAAAAVVEREHMFDKVVTPSDVGKLNRLVIPKQYAEKYFPLDSSANEKGLLLNFEDRNGKPWRFRYSYWNSSQSYVMTKGWSRFVKEKKLDAGDIVSFQRGAAESDKDRLFIDWRRRPDAPPPHPYITPSQQQQYLSFHNHNSRSPQYLWNNNNSNNNHLFLQQQLLHPNSNHPHFPHHHPHYGPFGYGSVVSNPVIYVRSSSVMPVVPQMGGGGGVSGSIGGSGVEPMVFDSVPVVHGKAAAKRLRLFGVNMDCPISDSEECNILSSSAISASQVSSSSPIHPLQLRLYNGGDSSSSPVHHSQEHKGKGSNSKSLDFDIN